jgi:hypothetical protein
VTVRAALTRVERDVLRAAYEDGDESMIVGSDSGVYAFPMGTPSNRAEGEVAHPDGAVWLPEFEHDDDRCLSSDQARQLAVALLEAAEHVEFGPGEWGADGVWVRAEYPKRWR